MTHGSVARGRVIVAAASVISLVTVSLMAVTPVDATALQVTVFSDGFESGTTAAWSTASGLTLEQTETHTGSWGARATSTGSPTYAQGKLSSATLDVTATEWLKLVSQSSAATVMALRTSSSTLVTVSLTKTHRLATKNAVTGSTLSGPTVSTGAWHQLQVHLVVGSSGTQEVWLDGAQVTALSTTQNLGTAAVSTFQLGGTEKTRKYDIVYDDASVTAPDTSPPSVPTNVAAQAVASDQVQVWWSASADNVGVAGYDVVRDGTRIAMVAAPATTFTDAGLAPGSTHAYAVDAFDASGNRSATSSPVSVTMPDTSPPSVPSGLQATSVGSGSVGLAWSASTDDVGVAGYDVFRNGIQVGTTASTTTAFTDTSLAGSTSYDFAVDAFDAAGNHSSPSTPLTVTTTATTDTEPPSAPKSVTATAVGPTEVDLAWSQSFDNIGVVSYRVYRGGAAVADVPASTNPYADQTFTDTTVAPSTTSTYTIDAVDAAGNRSSPSAAVSATTPAGPDTTPPTTPGSLGASAPLPTEVDLSWNASTDDVGVTGYLVSRDDAPIIELDARARTFADTTVAASTSYGYKVAAIDGSGNASVAASVGVTTPAVACAAPGGPLPTTTPADGSTGRSSTRANGTPRSARHPSTATPPR